MNWFIEQNEWTLPIFILSILIDFWAARHVDKHVHNPRLYLVLISSIVVNLIINWVYLMDGALFNISPIGSMVLIVLLCWVLVEIYEQDLEQ